MKIDFNELEKVHEALTTLLDWDILNEENKDYYMGWVDALSWVKRELLIEEEEVKKE